MRIGFDATVLGHATRYTGVGEYAYNLLRFLGDMVDGELIAFGPPGSVRPEGLPLSFSWRPLPRAPFGKASALVTHLVLLPRLARRLELDLLHVPTVHTRASMPPVPRSICCRLAVTIHDIIPLTFYDKSRERLPWRMRTFYRWNLTAALRADHIITVSETSRAEILDYFKLDPGMVTAIHNGVYIRESTAEADAALLDRLSLQTPYVLYVGSYEPRKNLSRLLAAFELAVDRGLEHELVLVVERRSGHAPALRQQIEQLRCRPRIRFLHELDEDQMWAVYRGAPLLAFPSLYEGFGLPAVQAMACGTPVLASDIPVMREVLGQAALFVDPKDVESLAAGILRLAQDQGLRATLARSGRQTASMYRWDQAAERTVEVYRDVLHQPAGARS
jgi:glycosyltransferase involved in cell wall biosynthesis